MGSHSTMAHKNRSVAITAFIIPFCRITVQNGKKCLTTCYSLKSHRYSMFELQ
jgi:hypothetical protein